MNYAAIKENDIADGPGVRVSLFVSGCTHHCKGCFQPETWNFDYGKLFDETTEDELMKALEPDYKAGLTLLGGEPMESENAKRLLPFVKRVRETYPSKNVWCYSGYLFGVQRISQSENYQCAALVARGESGFDAGVINCM